MSAKINAPVAYKWAQTVKVILSDIGDDCNEPIWVEPINTKQYVVPFMLESDQYVANQIVEKQMRYEESDRCPTTMALRYGV